MAAASSLRTDLRTEVSARKLDRVLYACFLDPSQKFGSLEEQVYHLAKAFRDRGGFLLPVFLAPMAPEACELYRHAGLTAETMNLTHFQYSRLKHLLGVLKRERIDVMHWNFYETLKNPYLWWLSILRPGLRHRFTEHSSRYSPVLAQHRDNIRERVKRSIMCRYEKVYGISDFVLRSHVTSYPAARTARWRYFVNTDRFRPDVDVRHAMRDSLGVAEDRFVITAIANLIRWKGVDVAIRAVAQLPERAILWVVGHGEEEAACRRLAGELGVADRVRFFGMTYNVAPLIQAADCLTCPSRWGEAVGLVNLEGLACGVPVVASAVGGIPEFIHDGENGLLVPPGDDHALAVAFRRLLEDPALTARLGHAARESALREHSIESQIDSQVAEYVKPSER